MNNVIPFPFPHTQPALPAPTVEDVPLKEMIDAMAVAGFSYALTALGCLPPEKLAGSYSDLLRWQSKLNAVVDDVAKVVERGTND